VALAEVSRFTDTVTYDDYLADFGGEFADIRDDPAFISCLAPDSYVESQALGATLLSADALGLIFPSVRHPTGTCIACFRPAAVGHVRKASTWQFTWDGSPTPGVAAV
jgi:hypothetical protein